MKNFIIVVMIFSGISLVHAQESPADGNLDWRNWTEEDWRNLTPDQADKFFPDSESMAETDDWEVNPLIYASAYSSVRTINKFIDNGAEINKKFDNEWTALGSAIIAGNNAIIPILISGGADINQQFGKENWTPLVAGIARENSRGVATLLGAGADQDVLQPYGFLKVDDIPQNRGSVAPYRPIAESFVDAWREAETYIMLSVRIIDPPDN